MSEPTLPFGTGPMYRSSDPDTPRTAAHNLTVDRLSKAQRAALHGLAHGPATDFELGERTGYPQTGAGKRRLELQRAGLVEKTEARRPSPNGSPAIVWQLTAEGVELHRQLVEEVAA